MTVSSRSGEGTLPIRVVVADDHEVVRQALKVLLEAEGLSIVGEAADGREAVGMCGRLQPDVVLLDLMMPGLNGLDAAVEVRRASAGTQMVLLTTHTDQRNLLRAWSVGFRACVFKSHSARELVRAIRTVAAGGTYLHPETSAVLLDAYRGGVSADERLSARERQVLQLIAEGNGTKDAAKALGVSVKTVESHRSRLMKKLGVHETAGLVRYAIRHGISEL